MQVPESVPTVTLPAACLTSNGVTATCAQVTQGLSASKSFKSASCTSAGSGCTCSVGLADQASTEMGTYTTTAAGVLTETPTGGTGSDSS